MSQTLLNLSARLHPPPTADLHHAVQQIDDWSDLPAQAEAQGLAPLLFHHLQQADIRLPREVRRTLHGLLVRHQRANQTRAQALGNLLCAFGEADIPVLVLKGNALAQLIYPTPALRPMRDIDLLVPREQIWSAQALLPRLGFNAPMPSGLSDKHMPAATRLSQGLTVSVELHHNLFNDAWPHSLRYDQLTKPPLPFQVANTPAFTLGYEDMLWHLSQHVAFHANVWEPIRLIWVADLVGFAETFVEQIDWAHVTTRYPTVINTLSLFHHLSPLSEQLRQTANIPIGPIPRGLGGEFDGWPRFSLHAQRHKPWLKIISDTLCPTDWWLRLHYQLNSAQPLHLYRWLWHPLSIFGWGMDWLRTR